MIECTKFTKYEKGSLKGFGSIFIEKWGVSIHGCSLHEKGGNWWVSFPSQKYEKDGETKYSPYFSFKDAEVYKKFIILAANAMKEKMHDFKKENIPNYEEIPF